jgi:hypothetical protein
VGLLLSNCLASGQMLAEAAKQTGGTFVLEWTNPSPDLEAGFGHEDLHGQPWKVVWQSVKDAGVRSGPVQFQLPLPPGKGRLWYGFRDRGRPETEVSLTTNYACPIGGRLRVKAVTYQYPDRSSGILEYQVSMDDTLWQEGCTFPDDPLAFTAPAVATVSARWLNPASDVNLVVLADRLYEVLITERQPSLQRRWMQSGAGTLWFEVTDASKQVWSVDSQAFRCADGGHLEVAIEATIVGGRPSLHARYEGHGCQATGPLRQKCGSDRRRPGRTRDSACFLPFPNARCCANAKGPG